MCVEPVPARFVKAMESVLGAALELYPLKKSRPRIREKGASKIDIPLPASLTRPSFRSRQRIDVLRTAAAHL